MQRRVDINKCVLNGVQRQLVVTLGFYTIHLK